MEVKNKMKANVSLGIYQKLGRLNAIYAKAKSLSTSELERRMEYYEKRKNKRKDMGLLEKLRDTINYGFPQILGIGETIDQEYRIIREVIEEHEDSESNE